MFKRALVVLAALLGCSVPNKSHCGNLDGDATCAGRDATRPYCDLCTAVNDGCVAEPVVAEGCFMASDSGAAGSTGTTATATGPTTGTSGTGTGTGTTGTTSTGTGTTTSTTEATSTTTGTGTGTTEMSTGTDSGTTTMPGPMCGNGVIDPGETCDGADLGGQSCTDYPNMYGGGDLACRADCKAYVFTGCCKLPGIECTASAQCCSQSCSGLLPPKKCD